MSQIFTKLYKIQNKFNHYNSKRLIKHFTKVTPEYDETFLTNSSNISAIKENIEHRKGVGDIELVHKLKLQLNDHEIAEKDRQRLNAVLQNEFRKIPNQTHPEVRKYGSDPKIIEVFNEEKTKFDFEPKEFSEIGKKLNLIRTEHLGNFTGHKSYYLMGDLAELEQSLIQYTMDFLLKKKFEIVAVPDILPEGVIESCGMTTSGDRTQVYRLSPSNLCLSGTSEMALAGMFSGKIVEDTELPIKLTSVSRCFRAETSGLQEEKGIYRVHQFTKVEMFSVCAPEQSTDMLEEFRSIEVELFNILGLHFKLLDMPPCELGAPAYRKYDIEAWLPGRKMWGEISSCSNCTDYQSRRLGVKIRGRPENESFAHTVNGTACAVPRMIIAILESFQNPNGTINVPEVLQSYMKRDKIMRRKNIPELKLVKYIPREKL